MVPGCAAFEAAMCARLRDEIDDARAGVAEKSDDEYDSFDDDGVDREARVMALEVAFAMCRAVPALLARNTEAPGKTSKPTGTGTGTGTDARGDVVRRWSDGNSVSDGPRIESSPPESERSTERRNSRARRWTSSRARPRRFARAVRISSDACRRRARRRRRIRGRRRRFLIVRRRHTRSARGNPPARRSSRARSIPRSTPRSNRRARRSGGCSRRSRRWRRRFASERRYTPRLASGREGPPSAREVDAWAATVDDAWGVCSSSENRRTSRTKIRIRIRTTTTTGGTTTTRTDADESRRRKLADAAIDRLVYYGY